MKNDLLISLLFASSLVATSNANAAPELQWDGSKYTGISGLNVPSFGIYDVTFSGTWNGKYGNEAFARAATDSLSQTITSTGAFHTTPFDLKPELTYGCVNPTSCSMTILTGIESSSSSSLYSAIFFSTVANFGLGNEHKDGIYDFKRIAPTEWGGRDISSRTGQTVANFTLSSAVSPIPEPSTWLMLITGLGLISLRKKLIS
jgi:hypothetical protein